MRLRAGELFWATMLDPMQRWREYVEKPEYAGPLTFGGALVGERIEREMLNGIATRRGS
ncbi:MAG: hypothetical protein ACXVUE_11285 [Solirubrobacteraceae bacterium]